MIFDKFLLLVLLHLVLQVREGGLEDLAVVEVHVGKGGVDPVEDDVQLRRVYVLGHNFQNCGQLLILLLQTQLLVHARNPLLESRLKS